MNAKFHPALKAIRADDVENFRKLIAADPSLATSRSTRSHPTLLQAVALDGKDKPNNRAGPITAAIRSFVTYCASLDVDSVWFVHSTTRSIVD